MFARVSVYEIPEAERSEAQSRFREALGQIRGLEGFKESHFLFACEGNRAMTITFWESNAAMAASRVAASRLRSQAARSVDGEVVSVDEFEVVAPD